MNILLVTPLYSTHFDAGWFWLRALNQLGHSIQIWDYRLDVNPPPFLHYPEITLVLKGETIDPRKLPSPAINYWPDALERTPGIEKVLRYYNKVFTPVRPTPDWMEWLPSGWDPSIHVDLKMEKTADTAYIGTNNSEYKERMIREIRPNFIFGNRWEEVQSDLIGPGEPDRFLLPPVYLHDFVQTANKARVLIDIHQSPTVGLNRKLFEMVACGFTIVDRVPGVEEIFPGFWNEISFDGPGPARRLIDYFQTHSEDREMLWELERKAIEPYTYDNCARRVLECLR